MEKKVTVSQIAIRYGLILGLIFIIISIIFEFLNLDMKTQQQYNYGLYLFVLGAIILAHKAFKEGGDGFMTIGQGLGMSDAEIEQAMKVAGIFMSAEMMIVWIILGMLFIGFILSLIVSLFTKKVNPNFEL